MQEGLKTDTYVDDLHRQFATKRVRAVPTEASRRDVPRIPDANPVCVAWASRLLTDLLAWALVANTKLDTEDDSLLFFFNIQNNHTNAYDECITYRIAFVPDRVDVRHSREWMTFVRWLKYTYGNDNKRAECDVRDACKLVAACFRDMHPKWTVAIEGTPSYAQENAPGPVLLIEDDYTSWTLFINT